MGPNTLPCGQHLNISEYTPLLPHTQLTSWASLIWAHVTVYFLTYCWCHWPLAPGPNSCLYSEILPIADVWPPSSSAVTSEQWEWKELFPSHLTWQGWCTDPAHGPRCTSNGQHLLPSFCDLCLCILLAQNMLLRGFSITNDKSPRQILKAKPQDSSYGKGLWAFCGCAVFYISDEGIPMRPNH